LFLSIALFSHPSSRSFCCTLTLVFFPHLVTVLLLPLQGLTKQMSDNSTLIVRQSEFHTVTRTNSASRYASTSAAEAVTADSPSFVTVSTAHNVIYFLVLCACCVPLNHRKTPDTCLLLRAESVGRSNVGSGASSPWSGLFSQCQP
jgi:hypothetical protein